MRSSKSRSRNKNSNRNRQSGNNLNRVFDSSGPEGKVRGTPQQIIEKYSQLARDATLGNDRVAAENFMQHSEHYTRLHAEAEREMDARREAQEREHRERQQARADQNRQHQQHSEQRPPRQTTVQAGDPGAAEQPDFVPPMAQEAASGLVDTPEQRPDKRRAQKPKPRAAAAPKSDVAQNEAKAAE